MSEEQEIFKAYMRIDNEHGTSTRPLKLVSMKNDFNDWRYRFRNFVMTNDPDMLRSFFVGPHVPTTEPTTPGGERVLVAQDALTDDDKKKQNTDFNAFGFLTQALSTQISMSLRGHSTTKALYDALVEKFEGNVDMKEARNALLETKWNNFNHFQGESITSILERYEALVTKLKSARIEKFTYQLNQKLLNALPYEWGRNVVTINKTSNTHHVPLEEICQTIQSLEYVAKQRLANHVSSINMVGMPIPSAFLSQQKANTYINPYLALAMGSESGAVPARSSSAAQPSGDDTFERAFKSHASVSNSSASNSSPLVNDYNIQMFKAFMACHEELLQGNLLPPNLEKDDLPEMNKCDLKRLDLRYQMAMTVHKVRNWLKKYGKTRLEPNGKNNLVDGKIGFKKDNVRCYKCDEFWHYSRECPKPKMGQRQQHKEDKEARIKEVLVEEMMEEEKKADALRIKGKATGTASSSDTKVMLAQTTVLPLDWSEQFRELMTPLTSTKMAITEGDEDWIFLKTYGLVQDPVPVSNISSEEDHQAFASSSSSASDTTTEQEF